MMLSTTTKEIARRLGDEAAIRIIAQAGFDAFDYSLCVNNEENPIYGNHYKEYVDCLKAVAKEYNIVCNQAHAYFPSNQWGDKDVDQNAFRKIVRGIEVASLLGAKVIVVHPYNAYPGEVSPEEIQRINLEFYGRLLPYCKKFTIKVALENMFTRDRKRGNIIGCTCGKSEEFRAYMEKVDPEWFVACLDLGHIGLVGDEAHDAIRVLGKSYLHALHVHDNDYKSDQHTLPYLGKVEWERVFIALAEIGYEDDFTYESDSFLTGFPDKLLPVASAFMCQVGRYMVGRIEAKKMGDKEKNLS